MNSIKQEQLLSVLDWSMVWVAFTGLAISITHYFELGIKAVVVLFIVVVFPLLSGYWFKSKLTSRTLAVYTFFNLWMIVGFGFINGFLVHFMNLIGGYVVNAFESIHGMPSTGTTQVNIWPDITGTIDFLGSMVMAVLLYKLRNAWIAFKEE